MSGILEALDHTLYSVQFRQGQTGQGSCRLHFPRHGCEPTRKGVIRSYVYPAIYAWNHVNISLEANQHHLLR